MIEDFKDNFFEEIDSNTVGRDLVLPKDLNVGARIYRLFYKWFFQPEPDLFSAFKLTQNNQNRIDRVMKYINILHQNVRALRSTTYTEKIIEAVVKYQLDEMKQETKEIIDIVTDELRYIIPICSNVR